MTEEERIRDMAQKLDDLHDFLMRESVKGKPSRARQLDDMLAERRAVGITVKAALWVAGAIAAVSAFVLQVRGLIGK